MAITGMGTIDLSESREVLVINVGIGPDTAIVGTLNTVVDGVRLVQLIPYRDGTNRLGIVLDISPSAVLGPSDSAPIGLLAYIVFEP